MSTPKFYTATIESTDTPVDQVESFLLGTKSTLVQQVIGNGMLEVACPGKVLTVVEKTRVFRNRITVSFRYKSIEKNKQIPAVLRELMEKLPGQWKYVS